MRIAVGEESVSALLLGPEDPKAFLLLAHGAGAGMTHTAMERTALGLAERGIATLRYQFLYMEKGSKRPDPPARAHLVVRAAAQEAARLACGLPLFAGGRSFGGRMTSQAQAMSPLASVRGLVFLGFPLHPSGKRGVERARHLVEIRVPMLFVSGERDALAETDLLRPVVADLGDKASLHLVAMADGSIYASGDPSDVLTGKTVKAVFGLASRVISDPVSGKPLVLPVGRYHIM